MNILFLDWKCFGKEGTIAAMKELGHTVFLFSHPDFRERKSEAFLSAFRTFIKAHRIDFCFSYNYYPVLAIACHEEDLRYISFLYDSPYVMLYSYTLAYPTNEVFLFDSEEYRFFANGGLSNVHYMVLPGDDGKLPQLLKKPRNRERLSADISFVGQLYNEGHTFLDDMMAAGDEYLNGYLSGLMEAQMKIQGYNFVEELLTPEIRERMYAIRPYEPDAGSVEPPGYGYANYFVDRKITSLERIRILNAVGERFPNRLKLFTWNKDIPVKGVRNMGVAEYETEMPLVFHESKINLNVSLRSIKNGIPLRCMDIMANGGFLLSNYQVDLCTAFIPGEDFVYYEDESDLLEKIDYYLSHDREREEIARNGCEKTRREHSFLETFRQIFAIAGVECAEASRPAQMPVAGKDETLIPAAGKDETLIPAGGDAEPGKDGMQMPKAGKEVITDKGTMYVWFTMASKPEYRSVLDVGLFLHRIGAISRQVADIGVVADKEIYGLAFPSEPVFAVMKALYQRVWDVAACKEAEKQFDLGLLLSLGAFKDECDEVFLRSVVKHCRQVFLDEETMEAYPFFRTYKEILPMHMDQESFYLIRIE